MQTFKTFNVDVDCGCCRGSILIHVHVYDCIIQPIVVTTVCNGYIVYVLNFFVAEIVNESDFVCPCR